METYEWMLVFLSGMAALRFYAYCKAKGKPWLTLVAAPFFAFLYTGMNFIFRYRVDLLNWSLGQGLYTYLASSLILSACIAAPLLLLLGIDKWRSKRVA